MLHSGRLRLTHKHLTRLERPAIDKHSSLLGTFANNGHKKFHIIWPQSNIRKIYCFVAAALIVKIYYHFIFVAHNRVDSIHKDSYDHLTTILKIRKLWPCI